MTRFRFLIVLDTWRVAFVEKYGDLAMELDALRAWLINEVESRIDLMALSQRLAGQEQERARGSQTFSALPTIAHKQR